VGSTILRFGSLFDKYYLDQEVPLSNLVSHQHWKQYLYEEGNKDGLRILEIGSREVTGPSDARKHLSKAGYIGFDYYRYIGFDYYHGPNVDVVGDAHKLSSYFGEHEKFDIIFCSACFEHFAMPWLVTAEIAKLLRVGGLVLVETHFSFSSHERPWHFFQFSDMALRVLFSPGLGFECIESGVSNPIVGRFSSFADKYLRFRPVGGLFCHSEYLGRKVKDVQKFDWNCVDLDTVVSGTKYPEPQVPKLKENKQVVPVGQY
jgi:SAM-dependent methyltransferase